MLGEKSGLKVEIMFKMKRLHEITKGVSADRKTEQSMDLPLGHIYT